LTGFGVVMVFSAGAAFAAMNTMYAAVGARTREIGTLRVLGFLPRQIYASFLFESVEGGAWRGRYSARFRSTDGCQFRFPTWRRAGRASTVMRSRRERVRHERNRWF